MTRAFHLTRKGRFDRGLSLTNNPLIQIRGDAGENPALL